ncbi:hypothetical protein CEP50_02775 [Actinopolyspora mortivallis]|uniref:CRISPR-associated endonuclease Cas2 n=1 Tax=Actinopolyspora mortivallis TaxID=33906 RepID=A0A2T0H085_ACTMO|nr:hypothetical protein CEP50_02775 [Actinopolyspora mortivallis]
MYTILVYDTLSERNARVLRTCRKHMHHMQRSVFEGQLSQSADGATTRRTRTTHRHRL